MKMRLGRATAAIAALALGLAVAACDSPTNQRPEPASISLSGVTDGRHDFGSAQADYTAITPLQIAVANTGGLPTGALAVTLGGANPGSFTASAISPGDIPAGETATFTVSPNLGLPPGSYAATVTVSGGEGITSQSFDVTFVVTEAQGFAISLSAPALHAFASAQHGYDEITPLTVTITNTGDQPTGALAVTLSGANPGFFTVSPTSIADIPVDGTATFTVGPNTGLPVGEYAATVAVSGANITARSFAVTFEVIPAPTFGISLSAADTETFGPFQVGYAEITPRAITVTNTGNQPTGALTVTLSGDAPGHFTASAISPSDIPVGETATFTIRPNHGLPIGEYAATVTVSGTNIDDQTFEVTFTVTEDEPESRFEITLGAPALHAFASAQYGYAAIPPLPVTITNTGNRPTGELTVTLSGDAPGSFAASAISSSDIPVGGTATFTVGPNPSLPVGEHAATVTVSGANITAQSFEVTFEVIPAPTFGISLSAADTETFGPFQVGYDEITPRAITVTNTGDQPTGALVVTLSGAPPGSFTASAISPR